MKEGKKGGGGLQIPRLVLAHTNLWAVSKATISCSKKFSDPLKAALPLLCPPTSREVCHTHVRRVLCLALLRTTASSSPCTHYHSFVSGTRTRDVGRSLASKRALLQSSIPSAGKTIISQHLASSPCCRRLLCRALCHILCSN
jgi:hypothetical protein